MKTTSPRLAIALLILGILAPSARADEFRFVDFLQLHGAAALGLAPAGKAVALGAGRAAHAGWTTDADAAKAKAKKTGKRVLMLFTGSDWCPWCKLLDREILTSEAFLDYADKNLVLLLLDFPQAKAQDDKVKAQNDQLAKDYGVKGFPTVVVLRADGTKAGETGYNKAGPAAFIGELEKLK